MTACANSAFVTSDSAQIRQTNPRHDFGRWWLNRAPFLHRTRRSDDSGYNVAETVVGHRGMTQTRYPPAQARTISFPPADLTCPIHLLRRHLEVPVARGPKAAGRKTPQ